MKPASRDVGFFRRVAVWPELKAPTSRSRLWKLALGESWAWQYLRGHSDAHKVTGKLALGESWTWQVSRGHNSAQKVAGKLALGESWAWQVSRDHNDDHKVTGKLPLGVAVGVKALPWPQSAHGNLL